ncbi:MAG TPA: AI-2E family transporter [Candidatus Saccharimonadales bacterium]|nr:AI-2E family transporter [Candidatus Saccharimonadales bacterium]
MNRVRIEIDTRTFVRFWLVVIGFALVGLAIYSAQTALTIVGAALFLAIALSPPVNRLARILPSKSRVLGTALAYIAVVALLGVIVFLVIPPIVQQTAKFAQTVPTLVETATKQYAGVGSFIEHYDLQPQVNQALDSIKNSASQLASGIGTTLITGIGSVFSAITATILILVLAFLMLVEGPTWLKRIWSVYADKDRMEYHRNLLARMYTVVTGYVTGQLSVSAIAGIVAGIVVFILSLIFNIPANLAIPTAAIVFVLSLIPLFGAMIGAVLVSVILALNDVTAAAIFLVFFILYQQVEANYISPKIQSKRIDLSALAILTAVTIGIYLFGIAGGIISIPIAGCIKVLAEDYFARARAERSKDGTVSLASVKVVKNKK